MKKREIVMKNFDVEFKWNRVFLVMPFLLLFMNSCTKDKDSLEDKLGEYNARYIEHEGIERTYQMYLPKNFNKANPTPLVLALHGGGGTGSRFEEDVSAGTLTPVAESRGVILVMPEGIDKRWNDGRSEHFGNDPMYDDLGFISALIDRMIEEYGADPNRVYATGISNGGFMSIRLALDLSEKIAAIAPVTAQLQEVNEAKVPDLPISMMLINGDLDPLVPYNGGCINNLFNLAECRGVILSTQETIEKFIGYNQCTVPGVTDAIIDSVNDETSVEITRYNDCVESTEVVLVKVIGGGHTWPSGAQYLSPGIVGRVSTEINASDMILDFFLSHSRN